MRNLPLLKFLKVAKCITMINLYKVYFYSKGTGPQTVRIEAQNQAGAKAQVKARYPGAYNIMLSQLQSSSKKKSD